MSNPTGQAYDRYVVNLAHRSLNIPGGPMVHYGRIEFRHITWDEAVRRLGTMKRLFEPEGFEVTMTAWQDRGIDVKAE